MSLMTAAAFFLIVCINVFFFVTIENKAIEVTNEDMQNIISNSRTVRDLSTVFTDIDFLNQTFLHNNDLLESEGIRLAENIKDILKNTLK